MATTILVIEDEPSVRMDIAEILGLEGYSTIQGKNGIEGLAMAQKYLPDLIICDIMMPGMTGYEVLTNLRSKSKTATIPFIFLTAKMAKSDFRHGMELGAEDYLTKPFSIAELLNSVKMQLKKKKSAARRIENLKVNLSFMISHELRTPLNVILGYSQVLLHPGMARNSQETMRMIKAIYESGKRLERLVENHLLYVDLKLENEDSDLLQIWKNREYPVWVKELILTVARRKAEEYERPDDLVLNIEDGRVLVSEAALVKIIEETLDNGFKFSKAETPVTVESRIEKDKFRISINSHGRALTKEQIKKIDAFNQFDRKKYEQQGCGLGLILVRQLIELNDGNFDVTSNENDGTTIEFIFDAEKAS